MFNNNKPIISHQRTIKNFEDLENLHWRIINLHFAYAPQCDIIVSYKSQGEEYSGLYTSEFKIDMHLDFIFSNKLETTIDVRKQ